jgi:tRNA pseudouridine55 synthase
MRLGVTTDTLDVTGEVTSVFEGDDVSGFVSPERVREVCTSLEGDVLQTPPAYSAIKYKGKKLYEYVRAGEEPPREALRPRRVRIGRIEVMDIVVDGAAADCDMGFAAVRFSVLCSSGVYVRSIVRDMGAGLGCGASMSSLTRTMSGVFTLAEAHGLDEVEGAAADGLLGGLMLPSDAAISFMPVVRLDESERSKFVNGMSVRTQGDSVGNSFRPDEGSGDGRDFVRVYGTGGFLGIGTRADGIIKPKKVMPLDDGDLIS